MTNFSVTDVFNRCKISESDSEYPSEENHSETTCSPDIPSPASSEIDIKYENVPSSQNLLKTSVQPVTNTQNRQNYVLRKGNKIIYTAGRPPWYDCHQQYSQSQTRLQNGTPKVDTPTLESTTPHMTTKDAFVIGLGGGSASGKTTVANNIIKALDIPWVVLVTMDSFYREYTEKEKELIRAGDFDFDNPSAMDFDLIVASIKKLKSGKPIFIPIYNYTTHSREKHTRKMYGANVILFEGIHAFYDKRLTQLMDIKIFVDTDSDICLARRLIRDISHRGRDLEGVLTMYERFVKPSFHHYIALTMAVADIIIPRGGENMIALDLITDHIKVQLQKRGFKHRSTILLNNRCNGNNLLYQNLIASTANGSSSPHDQKLILKTSLLLSDSANRLKYSSSNHNGDHDATTINSKSSQYPDSLYITPELPQTRGLHTIIRNKDVSRQDFIFFSRRLSRIALEYATSFLPYEPVTVETHHNKTYTGVRLKKDTKICGVSIIRAGETSERSLFEIFPPGIIRLGQILIQTNFGTGEPELFYYRLPDTVIKDCHVIVMDPTAATGATATMAIRVLIDHEVPEDRIIFVALILSEIAAQTIAYAFPKVKIITTAIDPLVSPDFYILPGIGNFGDRYYGTESQSSRPVSPIKPNSCYAVIHSPD